MCELSLSDFWDLPPTEWTNITKYDFNYVAATFSTSKDEAHRSYANDVKVLLENTQDKMVQAKLRSCLVELQPEVRVMEYATEATALRSYVERKTMDNAPDASRQSSDFGDNVQSSSSASMHSQYNNR
ncbi:hypothetical protein BX666DRAFT_1879783 [Dichotomocladium elegans]|nr:hypothetical protein BX666DRAFT_1879783 [Dichotomocladium elegans]